MPDLRGVSFATTLIAVPIWLGVLVWRASEINPAGVVVYGILLLFLAPASAYLTSRRLAPWALRVLQPVSPPWGGIALVTLGFAAIVAAEYGYWLWMSRGGGSSLGVFAWYLTLMLAPPIYCGILAVLAAATTRR